MNQYSIHFIQKYAEPSNLVPIGLDSLDLTMLNSPASLVHIYARTLRLPGPFIRSVLNMPGPDFCPDSKRARSQRLPKSMKPLRHLVPHEILYARSSILKRHTCLFPLSSMFNDWHVKTTNRGRFAHIGHMPTS